MKCEQKRRYLTRKEAKAVVRVFKLETHNPDFHLYLCNECGYYHCTSMSRKAARRVNFKKNKLKE